MIERFVQLSPEEVRQAVADAGFEPSNYCVPLNGLENRVFELRLEDFSHIVAKFYRPGRWTPDAILEEHRFLFQVERAEIPISAPLTLPHGGTLGDLDGLPFALWARTGGRAPDGLRDVDLEILGRMVARVHNVGSLELAHHRGNLDAQRCALDPLAYLEAEELIPEGWSTRFRAVVERLAALYTERVRDVPTHRIHGDCQIDNLLCGRGGWSLIDFDDFVVGPAVQDVWSLIPAPDVEGARQRQVFLDAYRQFRDFEDRWLRLMEPLRALRRIRRIGWIARRREDPTIAAAFPDFASDAFWAQQTGELERLWQHIEMTDDLTTRELVLGELLPSLFATTAADEDE